MKKVVKVFLVILILICVAATGMFFYIKSQPIPAVEIQSVDLNNIRDGSYTGEYDAGLVKATVKVDVAANKIAAVTIIKHECGLGKKAEEITKDVVEAQSLEVDTVSGATLSSKTILKAAELALKKGEISNE